MSAAARRWEALLDLPAGERVRAAYCRTKSEAIRFGKGLRQFPEMEGTPITVRRSGA